MRRFSNPVLLEWDESVPWSDAKRQRDYEEVLHLSRRIAMRTVPIGTVLFMAGFWVIGRIPGGAGPMPYRTQFGFAGPFLLFWLLPYIVLRLGIGKPTPGMRIHIRLHTRGIQYVVSGRIDKRMDWHLFDAFELGRWNDFDLLKLRLRGTYFSRRFGRENVPVEFGASGVSPLSIRQVLLDRGLVEETLNDPFANTQVVPLL